MVAGGGGGGGVKGGKGVDSRLQRDKSPINTISSHTSRDTTQHIFKRINPQYPSQWQRNILLKLYPTYPNNSTYIPPSIQHHPSPLPFTPTPTPSSHTPNPPNPPPAPPTPYPHLPSSHP